MACKQWTKEEERFIFQSIGKLTPIEMAIALKRTESSVRGRARRMGIKKLAGDRRKPHGRVLAAEEIEFLLEHAHEMTAQELATILGKSEYTIRGFCKRHGIKTVACETYVSSTICWECKWATGLQFKCPWVSSKLKTPVPGWKAEMVKMADYDTYKVIECPLYEEG